jgi:hypothetical protein
MKSITIFFILISVLNLIISSANAQNSDGSGSGLNFALAQGGVADVKVNNTADINSIKIRINGAKHNRRNHMIRMMDSSSESSDSD